VWKERKSRTHAAKSSGQREVYVVSGGRRGIRRHKGKSWRRKRQKKGYTKKGKNHGLAREDVRSR